jgi:predicted DNA-binding transcriptional regulator YafY
MNQMKMYRCIRLLELLQQKPRHFHTILRYLNVSQRTVYRYFDLFKQLGYEIHKDQYNKYYLLNSDDL